MSAHESPLPDPRRASVEDLLAHATWLRRLARSLVADSATADDLVQDTWIAALRKPPRSDQPLAPWLARVIQNLAHTRHRGDTRRKSRETARFTDHHEPGSDETAGSLEMQRLLIDAVDSLDEPQRSTLVRHYFHAQTSVEIAREDNIAEGTVRWRLKQAVDELKLKLDKRHSGDRRAWSAILLPLARRADIALPTATIATGAILMGTWFKVVAAALAVAIAVGGWLVTHPAEPVNRPTLATNAPTPVQALETPAISKPALETPVREALPNASADTPAASATSAAPVKTDYTAWVEARVLTTSGSPIAGALVTCIDNVKPDGSGRDVAPRATAGDDGRVRIPLKKSDASRSRGRSVVAAADTWLMSLEFVAPGKAAQIKEANVKAEGTFSLGDVVLADGGDVVGRVVDASGSPIAAADVYLILSDLTLEERDAVAKKGLSAKKWKGRSKTGDDGSFAVRAVPIGPYRVWSKLGGRLNAVSEPFEVRAGNTATVPDLLLPENTHAIRGVVLGLDGSPQRRAEVQYTKTESGNDFWVGVGSNDKGEFVIEEFDTPTVDVYAVGPWMKGDNDDAAEPRDRGQVLARDVKAGARDLVLRLAPTPLTRVTVRDTSGAVVDPIGVSLFDLRGNGGGGTIHGAVHNLRLLAKPCQIVVQGAGFLTKTVGPFEPGNIPATLEVVVERTAVVSGRITVDGEPCKRAWIFARRVLAPDNGRTQNGFPLRLDPQDGSTVSADQDGTFAFNVEKAGTWVIVVRSKGCANWESEPLELDLTHGKEGLEIALGRGGALEGRVASMTGADSEPAYVTLSRGTGFDSSARVKSDGTFRLDMLTPGTWKVGMTREDWSDGGVILEHMPADPAAREIRIEAGKTAHVDLDARAFTSPKVAGRIVIQGVDATKWTANLFTKGATHERGPSSAIDANGAFLLVADEVGPHRLKLISSVASGRTDTIEQELDLSHGTTEWVLDVATGSVRLPAAASGDVVLAWTATSGAKWTAHVRKTSDAEMVLAQIPAGSIRIQGVSEHELDVVVVAGKTITADKR